MNEKSKIFYDENLYQEYSIENIHNQARFLVKHFTKLDAEKIKIYVEDMTMFFNIHNHPEIQIVGDNSKKNVCDINKKINLNDSSPDQRKNKNKYLNNNSIDCSENYSNISKNYFNKK